MTKPALLQILPLAFTLMLTAGTPKTSLEDRRQAFNAQVSEWWEYTLRTNPELASMVGDKRFNDKLTDFSQTTVEANIAQDAKFLRRIEAIDSVGFSDLDKLNRDLIIRTLRHNGEGVKFKDWEMPVSVLGGANTILSILLPMLSFETIKDYEDYCSRLKQIPRTLEQITVQMRKGIQDGLMPMKIHMPEIIRQSQDLQTARMDQNPLAQPLARFPAAFPESERVRISRDIETAITTKVIPAYAKFTVFLKTEYAPNGREKEGFWALPNGREWYAFLVKGYTTPDWTPDQLHALGLGEVARIEKEMAGIAQKLGFKDLKTFNASLKSNPALHLASRQDLLDRYSKHIDRMYEKLPLFFNRLPKGKLKVVPEETLMESKASSASYRPGTPDGSRVGQVVINTGDYAQRLTPSIETTSYHEGVPGHHLQMSIALELPELPAFRQFGYAGNPIAFGEGWALYSEQLGKEAGFFEDPYSLYGHYQDDMLRAIRLVVDTGLHYKGWSRQQVVDYFHAHSGADEVEVQNETDRYIVIPGQALAYKVGQLKILDLRAFARKELGSKFDIREFHDVVLGAGPLPLDVLDKRVKEWVVTARSKAN